MPVTRIDICDLIHTRPEESLEISSSCSIVLTHNVPTSSILDEIAAASELPTFENLWVQRSGRLRLSIALVLDAISLTNQQKEIFVSQLGTNFTNAELWRQLGLHCSLFPPVDTSTFSNEFERIEFTLSHAEAMYTATKGFKPHIIANTRPPDGVPTADLQEISIIWALSSITSSTIDRDSKRLNGGTLMVNTDKIVSPLEENDSDGYISISQLNPRLPSWNAEHRSAWPSSMAVKSGTSTQILEEATDKHQEISIVPLLYTQDSAAHVSQQWRPRDTYRKRPRSISSPLVDLLAAQKLIDVAFHELISGRNMPELPKVRQTKAVARPKLSDISPALFSPGYLQALSRQSQCVSTIAYSMASVHGRTTSKPLKDAFALLWNTESNTDSFIGGPPSPEAQNYLEGLASIIKARTWMIIQRLLFEPAAAATLKPLSYGVSQGIEEPSKHFDEPSSPATLIETLENTSSPATEMLDNFCLSDEDFEPLFDESDAELLLDEYDVDSCLREDVSHQKRYASSHGLSARLPMSRRYHPGSYVADEYTTRARNHRAQSELLDTLDISGSNVGEPVDTNSPFEALDIPDVSSIGRAEQVDMLSDPDPEMLLANQSNDWQTIGNGEEFLDAMEMLDRLSVDGRRASVDDPDSEPDEMLDTFDLDDELDEDCLGHRRVGGI